MMDISRQFEDLPATLIITGSTALAIIMRETLRGVNTRDLDLIVPRGFQFPETYRVGSEMMFNSKTLGLIELKKFTAPSGLSIDAVFTDIERFSSLWQDVTKSTIIDGVHVATLEFLVESYLHMTEPGLPPIQSLKAKYRLLHIAIMLTCESRTNATWFWNSRVTDVLPILQSLKEFRDRLVILETNERRCDVLSGRSLELQNINEELKSKVMTLEVQLQEMRVLANKASNWKESYEKVSSQLQQYTKKGKKSSPVTSNNNEFKDMIESINRDSQRYQEENNALKRSLDLLKTEARSLRESRVTMCDRFNDVLALKNGLMSFSYAHNMAATAMAAQSDMKTYLLSEMDEYDRRLCSTSLCRLLLTCQCSTVTMSKAHFGSPDSTSSVNIMVQNSGNVAWIVETDIDAGVFHVVALEKQTPTSVGVYAVAMKNNQIEDRPILDSCVSVSVNGSCRRLSSDIKSRQPGTLARGIAWGAGLLFENCLDIEQCAKNLHSLIAIQ